MKKTKGENRKRPDSQGHRHRGSEQVESVRNSDTVIKERETKNQERKGERKEIRIHLITVIKISEIFPALCLLKNKVLD